MARSLVLDQSTTTVGFAVVENSDRPVSFGVKGSLLHHGRITTKSALLADRLISIQADLRHLIAKWKPDEIVVEQTTFSQKFGSTSNALGAIYVLCRDLARANGMAFYTQGISTIKKVVGGHGHATKDEVKEGVVRFWGIPKHEFKDDNHADALAAAYTWLYRGDEARAAAAVKTAKRRAKG